MLDFILIIFYIMENAVAKMDQSMLERGSQNVGTTSVYESLHKVSIYNPDYSKWDAMDLTKAWLFRLREANTGEEKMIEPFKFWLLAIAKVMSGKVTLLNELWDTLINDKWEQVSQFFYTSEYGQYSKKTEVIWFKNMTSKPQFFTREQLFSMLTSPNINGTINPFFTWGKKADNTKYKSTEIKDQTIIFGEFIDWPYVWDYFMMYVKNSSLGITYKAWEQVVPEYGTLMHAINVEWVKAWNEATGKTLRSVSPDQLDLSLNLITKNFSNKDFNIAEFRFSNLTWMRKNNLDDVQYIKELRDAYFVERFWSMQSPSNVRIEWVNAIVDFKFEAPTEVKWVLEVADSIQEADVEEVFVKPTVTATPAKEEISIEKIPF